MFQPRRTLRVEPRPDTAAVAVAKRDSDGRPIQLAVGARIKGVAALILEGVDRPVGYVDGLGEVRWGTLNVGRELLTNEQERTALGRARTAVDRGQVHAVLDDDGSVRAIRLGTRS